jgi:hypothetical protein
VTDDDVEHEPRDPELSDGPGVRDLLSLGGMLVGTGLGIAAAGVGFWLRIRAYLIGR